MTLGCGDASVALGAYVVGALEHRERAELEAHLGTCPACRDELASLAPLPGLLSRLTLDEAIAGPPPVDGAMLERLMHTASRERRVATRRRWLAVAAAVAVLGGGSAGGVVAWNAAHATHWQRVVGAQGRVHVRVDLQPSSTGTQLALWLSGVPADARCRLIAVSDTGAREVAGSWEATYGGTAVIHGTTAIPRAHLRQLVIETYDGVTLIAADVPRQA